MRELLEPNYTDDEKIPQLIKTKFLYLCSRNRHSGNINGFEVNIPSSFFRKTPNQQIKISLQSITLPKTWYECSVGSSEYENSIGNCSIPEGSYDVENLVDILNNDTSFSNDYLVSYSYTTNKLTFTAQYAGAFLKPTKCGWLLGLDDYTTYTGDFTSTYPLMMTYYKTIYINTNLSSNGASLDNVYYKALDTSTILQTIPCEDGPFDIIQYTTNSPPNSGVLIEPSSLDSIRVWISNDRGTVFTLTKDWEICLKIEFFVVK